MKRLCWILPFIILIFAGCSSEQGQALITSEPTSEAVQAVIDTPLPASATSVPIENNEASTQVILGADEDVSLTVTQVEFRTVVGNRRPGNDLFLILYGELNNTNSGNECVFARDVRLYLDGDEYRPQNDAMDAVKQALLPDRDFIGAFSGQCLDGQSTALTFAVFEVPAQAQVATIGYYGVETAIGIQFPIGDADGYVSAILLPAQATSVASVWTATFTPAITLTATSTLTATETLVPSTVPLSTNTALATATSIPTSTPLPSATTAPPLTAIPAGVVTSAPVQTYYTTGVTNLRPCPNTTSDCAFIFQIPAGTAVNVVGTAEGEAVSQSTLWYIVVYNGQTVYGHSSLLSLTQPIVAPVQSGGNTGANQSPATAVQSQWSCSGNDYNCPYFENNCAELAAYWAACPGDPSDLDGDGNGLPCERQCP